MQQEIRNMIDLISIKEVESLIKNIHAKKCPGPDTFSSEFFQIFKK